MMQNHLDTLRWTSSVIVWIFIVHLSTLAMAQMGDVTGVHDPSIIRAGDRFYLFSTGRGIGERSSNDLFHWTRLTRVLEDSPVWTRDYIAPNSSIWAPDITFCNNEYRLYYAVSSFGKTVSAIGLTVNKSLDPTSRNYQWIDRGKVIATQSKSDWNAIDPCALEDADGNAWMVLGSFWSGLKLIQLDPKTGLSIDPNPAPISIAAYPPENAIEEGYIRRRGDFYYLWESVNRCCRGVDSTYRILVGRSKSVRGPYLDRDGKPLLKGGGTLVLAGYEKVRGPGSCAIVSYEGREFLVHHEYDAGNRGTPTLQIRQLFWADDGWPVVGEPIARSPSDKPPVMKSLVGNWNIRYDFGTTKTITLHQDHHLSPVEGNWESKESTVVLKWKKAVKTLEQRCTVSDDGSFFVGRTDEGAVILATREKTAQK